MDKKKRKDETIVEVQFCEDDIKYSCTMSRVKHYNTLKIGDIRNVKWRDLVFYPAIIKKIRLDGLVDVKFIEDGIRETVSYDSIQHATSLQVNDIRDVQWEDGKYYEARILTINTTSNNEFKEVSVLPSTYVVDDTENTTEPTEPKKNLTILQNASLLPTFEMETLESLSSPGDEVGQTELANTFNSQYFVEAEMSIKLQDADRQTGVVITPQLNKKIEDARTKLLLWKKKREDLKKMGLKGSARRVGRNIKKLLMTIENESTIQPSHNALSSLVQAAPLTNITPTEVPIKKVKRKEKKQNYCLYCDKLVKEYCIHLEKHHADTEEGKQLADIKEKDTRLRGLLKKKITDKLRKKANNIYNERCLLEKSSEIILVKSRHTAVTSRENTSICKYCKGYYKKDRMTIHLNRCKDFKLFSEENSSVVSVKCVKQHMVPLNLMAMGSGVSEELKNEVLQYMKDDEIKKQVLSDSLIISFGVKFHQSRRSEVNRHYVSMKMRDLASLVLKMKNLDSSVNNLDDCLNPAKFETLLSAVMELSQYDKATGQLKVPSIAYRMSQPLKIAATVAKTEAIRLSYQEGSKDVYGPQIEKYSHFLDMVASQWALSCGRMATNMRKAKTADKQKVFALQEDIVKVCSYIIERYRKLMSDLMISLDKSCVYDELMTLLVVHIMCLVRRRPVDFKRATILHVSLLDAQDTLVEMVKNTNVSSKDKSLHLEDNDLENCKNFHIFYVPGKNMEIVPIVLTRLMKEALDALITARPLVDIINKDAKTDKLFVMSNQKLVNPVVCLQKVKKRKELKLKSPDTFTNNGLRHQAATFSKLQSDHPQYQDFLAGVLGHTLFIHKKHYELPTSIIQKMIVCPILHKMTTATTKDQEPTRPVRLQKVASCTAEKEDEFMDFSNSGSEWEKESEKETSDTNETVFNTPKRKFARKRKWRQEDQDLIFKEFGEDIANQQPPFRRDVKTCFERNTAVFKERTLQSLCSYIDNLAKRKQKNVTPLLKKF